MKGGRIVFQWMDPCSNERLKRAQNELLGTILEFGLEPVLFPAGPALVKFGEILEIARKSVPVGSSFVWCNSDVTLTADPYSLDDGWTVRGFHRREIPSGEICGGVDMYLIPCGIWDKVLSRDVPDLWCGGTHIDWWLTRAASLTGCYSAHFGYIEHVSHAESPASKSKSSGIYRHNIREYNAWARRNGAGLHETRVGLPFVGESMSPACDFLRLFRMKLRARVPFLNK